ncbi:hypothetical protein WA026_017928 [Henosepilachna vigintioctopunctata]|uniref:Gustatory receptor n=1 Tax=Henosepilachna vigintioctopunctata TaxID=420089 RepID=A0AAW1TV37_9CUCU
MEMVRRSDELLTKTGYKFKYNAAFSIKFLSITFGMYFIIFNLSLELWNSPRENIMSYSISEFILISWPQFVIHFAESRFALGSLLHYTRFFAVNMILESLYRSNGGKNFLLDAHYSDLGFLSKIYSFEKKPDVSNEYVLYCTMKSHYTVYRATLIWSNLFGVIIMLSALIQFTSIAFAICFCYYNINTKPVATVTWLLWALLRFYELCRKTYIAHLVRSEANKCIHFVDKLLMLQWNIAMKRRLNIFSLQLNHCKVKYTACGLFEVDETLIFTIVASATMYLIVTYQFQQGQMTDCGNRSITTTIKGLEIL